MISDSIGDFILGLRAPELFLEKALLTADKVQVAAAEGLRQILKLFKWCAICIVASLLVAILLILGLCTGWSPAWLNFILITLCGLGVVGGLVVMAPIAMLAQPVFAAFPEFKGWLTKYLGTLASAGFLTLFALISYWRLQKAFSPGAAASIFLVMLIIGVGSATGWVLLPRSGVKSIITGQLFLCLFFLLASAIFPKLVPATSRLLRHNESLAAEVMDDKISQLVEIDPDDPPKVWFNADGSPRFCFTQNPDGVFRIFHADVENDPGTGQKTSLVTTVEKRDEIVAQVRKARDVQKRQSAVQAAERDQKAKVDADRQFREKYLDATVLSAINRENAVLLMIKAEPTGGDREIVAQHLSAWLLQAKKMPVVGALKPAFLDDGLFDAVWNGDGSAIDRLQMFQGATRSLLLAKVEYTRAEKTDFEGLLSVRGTLSFIAIDGGGRKGPTSFASSGAGADVTTAKSNCAKRLVDVAVASAVLRE
ncbi:MAG: hypothetical protein K8T91_04365 [Planctomycetes bacterium]|nr:hypothetical protein [Planctomycetota bacterium]